MADPVAFHDGRVVLHAGDCLDVLKTLPDASIDSVVTDPPYALVSITKRFGKEGAAPAKVPEGGSGAYMRASAGFMGKHWGTGERAFAVEFWAEVFRVLKPGGHVLAFAATRTHHRLTCAIEDAGFEIRDMIAWLYGTGFPKSHDVAKGIDQKLGVTREVVGTETLSNDIRGGALLDVAHGGERPALVRNVTVPTSDAAREWAGWGTALKPALEPVTVARKPLAGTVAETVLAHGTGALNIDGCRIGTDGGTVFGGKRPDQNDETVKSYGNGLNAKTAVAVPGLGRWPANVVHDGSGEVEASFPESESPAPRKTKRSADSGGRTGYGTFGGPAEVVIGHGDAGSAARFFFSAKADGDDRIGSKHPTVKPVDLMRWMVRLITPPGGTVLDPFAGTGTTGEAAWREGFCAVLIEREEEYRADIARRMALTLAGPALRRAESAKARDRKPSAPMALFGEG